MWRARSRSNALSVVAPAPARACCRDPALSRSTRRCARRSPETQLRPSASRTSSRRSSVSRAPSILSRFVVNAAPRRVFKNAAPNSIHRRRCVKNRPVLRGPEKGGETPTVPDLHGASSAGPPGPRLTDVPRATLPHRSSLRGHHRQPMVGGTRPALTADNLWWVWDPSRCRANHRQPVVGGFARSDSLALPRQRVVARRDEELAEGDRARRELARTTVKAQAATRHARAHAMARACARRSNVLRRSRTGLKAVATECDETHARARARAASSVCVCMIGRACFESVILAAVCCRALGAGCHCFRATIVIRSVGSRPSCRRRASSATTRVAGSRGSRTSSTR